ncbi:hypothetical protein F8M41_004822 [Gigaspora margarita]|uniref:Uncharacterized protein n=1 Tax=Gigaspora margarita TaxID=4874 RepID=A0A8H4A5F4_GIGMA|nr:hypothetical protein F8M41_004822 [Gigaspora margarita]
MSTKDSTTPKSNNEATTPKTNDATTPKTNNSTTPKTNDVTTPKTNDSTTPNYSKSKRQYKPREFLSYNDTWGKMSKENLERDRDNDDNDWINSGQRQEMLN